MLIGSITATTSRRGSRSTPTPIAVAASTRIEPMPRLPAWRAPRTTIISKRPIAAAVMPSSAGVMKPTSISRS
jgi:hypothetical protein